MQGIIGLLMVVAFMFLASCTRDNGTRPVTVTKTEVVDRDRIVTARCEERIQRFHDVFDELTPAVTVEDKVERLQRSDQALREHVGRVLAAALACGVTVDD
jgi:hypothetical protein